jgi:glycosyltransferase involved in cell wall biosynthesis
VRWVLVSDDWLPCAGGVATWGHRVAAALAAGGHTVDAFVRARPGLVAPTGVRVLPVRGPSFARRGALWHLLTTSRRAAGADAVLATTARPAQLLASMPGVGQRLQVCFHGSDVEDLARPRVWHTAHRARARWSVSRYLAEATQSRGIDSAWLPAPVQALARPRRAPKRLKRWGYVARAVPGKGGERFLRIVAAAGAEGWMIGDGPELPKLRRLAAKLGASIRFTGHLSPVEVQAQLDRLDLVCLFPDPRPLAEGLGLSLLEAAARGVPVVGARVGGVPEAVGPGLLLDSGDGDPGHAASTVAAWWTPERGEEAWDWVRKTHGPQRTVEHLAAAAGASS